MFRYSEQFFFCYKNIEELECVVNISSSFFIPLKEPIGRPFSEKVQMTYGRHFIAHWVYISTTL